MAIAYVFYQLGKVNAEVGAQFISSCLSTRIVAYVSTVLG